MLISGYDGVAAPDNELPLGQPLFEQYQTQVDLPKKDSTQDFAIPAEAGRQPAPRVRSDAPV